MAHGAVAERRAAGQIGDAAHVRRPHDALAIGGNIGENSVQIDVLLGVGADQIVKGVAGDGQDGLVVHLCVVKPVEQMDAAGTGGGQADAELPGVFGVGAGHEGGGLLVSHVNEADLLLALAQRFHDAVDSVAGKSEDDFDAPVHKGIDQDLRGCTGHFPLSIPRRRRRW